MFRSIRQWLEAHHIFWHAQNLNDDAKGRPVGSMFWRGRAWLHLPRPLLSRKLKAHRELELGFEWSFRRDLRSFGIMLHTNDERAVLNINLGFLSIYPSVTGLWTTRNWRDTGIEWHHEFIWLNFYHDDDGWAKDWKGLHLTIAPLDLLLGRKQYTDRVFETERAVIPMPEGAYPATIKFHERTAKRPRWFRDRYVTASIKPDAPIGIPGKGENSWDCDDDAIFELSCGASTVPAAVASVVESALRTRDKYGWDDVMVQYAPNALAQIGRARLAAAE